MFQPLILALALVGLTATSVEHDNSALLGVVAIDANPGLLLAEVIGGSAADQAGLLAGDLLLDLQHQHLTDPGYLDRLLSAHKPGDELAFKLQRGDQPPLKGKLTLGARSALRTPQLQTRKRGQIGFKAPAWYGYGWSNLDKGEAAPSLKSCAGKVIVIHAFQSW